MNKQMKILAILVVLLLTACTKVTDGIEINLDGKTRKFETRSSFANHTTKSFSYPEKGKIVTESTSFTTVVLSNLDSTTPGKSMATASLENSNELRIQFTLNGEKGTSGTTPIRIGRFEIGKDRFSSVSGIQVRHSIDGNERTALPTLSGSEGFIEITSVENGQIVGSIDFRSRELKIQGDFVADGNRSVI